MLGYTCWLRRIVYGNRRCLLNLLQYDKRKWRLYSPGTRTIVASSPVWTRHGDHSRRNDKLLPLSASRQCGRGLTGIMRFRTFMPCVSLYLFLRFRKVYFCVLWHFLIDALRFRNTASGPPTSQTDRQTTCNLNTALCAKVHRVVKTGFRAFHVAGRNQLAVARKKIAIARKNGFARLRGCSP